jgi:hypothetical protein
MLVHCRRSKDALDCGWVTCARSVGNAAMRSRNNFVFRILRLGIVARQKRGWRTRSLCYVPPDGLRWAASRKTVGGRWLVLLKSIFHFFVSVRRMLRGQSASGSSMLQHVLKHVDLSVDLRRKGWGSTSFGSFLGAIFHCMLTQLQGDR